MSPTPDLDLHDSVVRGHAWKMLAIGTAATALEVWVAIVLLRAIDVDAPGAWLGGLALFIGHMIAFRALANAIPAWKKPLPLRWDRLLASYVFHVLLAVPVALVDLQVGVSVLAGSLLWGAAFALILVPVSAAGLLIAAAQDTAGRR